MFLISGLLSLVYVTQLLNAAVKQSYDANRMVANQVRLALAECAGDGAEGPESRPQQSCANSAILQPRPFATTRHCKAVVDSVNRYSLTVYDINIGDSQSRTLVSTNPLNEDKPLPVRPDYSQLLKPIPSS